MSKMDWISIVMECMKTFSLSQPDLNQFAGMTHLSHSESGSVGHPLAPQNGRFSWQTALKSYAHLDDKVHSSWLDLNQISIENGWSQTLFLKSLRNSNFQVGTDFRQSNRFESYCMTHTICVKLKSFHWDLLQPQLNSKNALSSLDVG